ncbi:MAG: glutathione peroxidase [Leptospiraceae bacterium]|nr:glutathione peroxidase [Leptospiraceae bacterium]
MNTNTIYHFEAQKIDGQMQSMADYKGQVLLVVNTASKCGFTPQYDGLQDLYQKYRDQGFQVLGFPCNQFGSQEPGDASEIQSFCSLNFNVSFPLFAKVDVNGEKAHAMYTWLKERKPGALGTKSIKWNFTKFLIDRQGQVVKRYSPDTKPDSIASDIETLLASTAE